MQRDSKVAVLTAAMCEGNKLQKIRDTFPERFFDVGICESHAVAFAAGMAKAGARPVVDIYSTFLQRSFDQIFQEVALQNLPVLFTLDRAGLVGADGPTHHGTYDLAYMRIFPNLIVMAPGDARDVAPMIDFALQQTRRSRSVTRRRTSRRSSATGPADRAGPGRDPRMGDRRHVPRLRHARGHLPAGGGAAPPPVWSAGRRDQRPLRQAARPGRPCSRPWRSAGSCSRSRRAASRAGLARQCSRRSTTPDSPPTTSAGSDCPTASCSMPSATSNSPRSGSTWTESPRLRSSWPARVGLAPLLTQNGQACAT